MRKAISQHEETAQKSKDLLEEKVRLLKDRDARISDLQAEIEALGNKNTKLGMNLVQVEKDLREVFEREHLQKDEINRLGRLTQKLREETTLMEDQLLQNATWLEEKSRLVD